MDLFCNNNCKNRVVSNLDLISKSYFKYMKQTLNSANIGVLNHDCIYYKFAPNYNK